MAAAKPVHDAKAEAPKKPVGPKTEKVQMVPANPVPGTRYELPDGSVHKYN